MGKSAPAIEEVHHARVAQIEEIKNTPGVLWKPVADARFASQAPGASSYMNGVKGDQTAVIQDLVQRGEIIEHVADANLVIPDSFDSEQNWPHCAKIIGDIRDQSNCGCCWAFAGAEAGSDRMCIATNASIMVPLSAQDACFNGGGLMSQGCNGGQISSPWSYLKKGGLFGGKGMVSGGQYQGSDPYPAEGAADAPSKHLQLDPKHVTLMHSRLTTTLPRTSIFTQEAPLRLVVRRTSSLRSWLVAQWKSLSQCILISRIMQAVSIIMFLEAWQE